MLVAVIAVTHLPTGHCPLVLVCQDFLTSMLSPGKPSVQADQDCCSFFLVLHRCAPRGHPSRLSLIPSIPQFQLVLCSIALQHSRYGTPGNAQQAAAPCQP
jgi:hypothetical protein